MAGEISLRGLVLPVWGIKEKVLAAQRVGLQRILLPARNEKDLRELTEVTRAKLKFVFLETVDIRYTPLWVNGGQVAWVRV